MPRRAAPVVLALDIGTSSVRSALFDENARAFPQSRASAAYRVCHSADHGAELDPAVLLRATKKCLRLTKSPISTVTGSGFWHSLLGLDRAGKPLTPIYTWADARCAADAASLREELDERAVQQRTGCMLRASFWPAKLLWLRRTQPKVFRRVARWVSPAEWIFEELFSVRACSHSMASGTGLYDFLAHDWDRELLELTGLTSSQLNPLRDRVASIFPAIGDGAASNLGSGASAPGIVAINVGTSGAVRAIPPPGAPLPFGLFRFVVDHRRGLLGGAVSNAGNLRAWCLRELRLSPNERKIEQLLQTSAGSASRLTILPFWTIERAPTWPENLDGIIVGLTQTTTAVDLLHATTAAVCHRLADIFDRLEGALGRSKKIVVSGGILQSPASLQILADSLGRDLATCADQEASLRGAAVCALEQSGRKVPEQKRGKWIRHDRKAASRAREARHRQEQLECSAGL
ncbi:MAG: carbohydrate kinase [Chthoniobacterales bacterium]|nr:carbohydrate kinase [Chthoniobacterales bacterium]